MNHPPKKKHKNPLLPDDGQIDERNLVDLEESEEFSFEDRASIYWAENKGFLIGCILVLLLVVAGYQTMRIVKERIGTALQAEYAKADANGTLADFATTHNSKELGGFAALKIANEAYVDEDYEKALEFYSLAASVLESPILAGRAQIGQAFALYYNGNTDEGLARLNTITTDNTLAESIRTEAAYHLALEAHTAGRTAEFASYTAQVNNSKFAGQWQQRLQRLPAAEAIQP